MAERKLQPIVVKRVRKTQHAAHGGAWKIAYADFVTAMMAFFLLMWLLGSTTQGDLQGIAEYFRTPLKVALSGGDGSGDSSSVIKGGGTELTRTTGAERRGDTEARQRKVNLQALRAELRAAETKRLTRLKSQLDEAITRNVKLAEFRSQIKLDLTPDGLRIQIVDEQNRPMFDNGRATVKEYMRDLLREIATLLNSVDNRVSISGHTDSAPYGSGERGYSNWELSADRANASRRELVAGGLSESKVVRVIGLGSSVMYDAGNPRNPMNRRISIVVLNQDAEERVFSGTEVDTSAGTGEAGAALGASAAGTGTGTGASSDTGAGTGMGAGEGAEAGH
ncbi:MAG: flagellar motor protein MotB [Burkholderiales bacterium]|nr:flagellar motor protein MotB [Burkholderiales bacterium]OJX09109.1 MAG: flagellar motor protein MotB [Burkholderiales bacterium 70-64]